MPRAATTSDVFNAVAESRRRDILALSRRRERPVGDIVAALELGQPSVSKHLKVLRDVGLVHVRREGRQIFYRTNPRRSGRCTNGRSTFERFWRHQLTRVKERAEASDKGRNAEIDDRYQSRTLTLNLTEEIHVRASLEATFDALLEQMGPGNETPDGTPLPMTIEAAARRPLVSRSRRRQRPLLGHVQAIKRPTLLEITGPLFMSFPVVSNVQYRLKEVDGGTLITFRHSALGFVPGRLRKGLTRGWTAAVRAYARGRPRGRRQRRLKGGESCR